MAKIIAPLFSFSASGAIGKALVYFGWKGIPVVRRFVVPANPDSNLQKAQRLIMANSVAKWHLAVYTAADKTAWDRYAATLAEAMSGFNAFVRSFIDITLSVHTPNPPYGASLTSGGAGLFDAYMVEDDSAADAHLYWGYSKSAMNTKIDLVEAPAGTWRFPATPATVGADVYGWYETHDGAAHRLGRSGIYTMKVV
jgi:hypothetical protein